MARFKHAEYAQITLVPVVFSEQILPGTLEDGISRLIDRHVDLSRLRKRFGNDKTGAPAYDPAVLLKIILFAYSRGICSSRRIEEACRSNVVFMALSGNSRPDRTTISSFVATQTAEMLPLFQHIVGVCMRLGLVGGKMFALDGCKISSNAAKEWSGTFSELSKRKEKIRATLEQIMRQHRGSDRGRLKLRIERRKKEIQKIDRFLKTNKPRQGKRGNEIKSNITDNESAKMKTSHGVIQGYNGMALVDAQSQVVIQAGAFGSGPEGELLRPVLEGAAKTMRSIGAGSDFFRNTKLLADTGLHTEDNLKFLEETLKIDPYIPDPGYRKRDERFQSAVRHRDGIQGRQRRKSKRKFELKDFEYDPENDLYTCPAGKTLRTTPGTYWVHRTNYRRYVARESDCAACPLRDRCLKKSETKRRNLHVMRDSKGRIEDTYSHRMKMKIDTDRAREIYAHRMGTVEPVFANITFHKKLNRFTLRGRTKVNAQWLLFCIVHNIGKIAGSPNFRKLAA